MKFRPPLGAGSTSDYRPSGLTLVFASDPHNLAVGRDSLPSTFHLLDAKPTHPV